MTPQIKICGVNDAAFAVRAAEAGVDYLGFIFVEKSPRRVVPEQARTIIAAVRSAVSVKAPRRQVRVPRFVGVFVSHSAAEVAEIAAGAALDVVQLHGDYGADDVAALKAAGLEVWRLAPGSGDEPAGEDAVLIDGRDGSRSGGTGRLADWSQVAALKRSGRRVVLAGGISAENISAAAATGADVLDVNSSLETSPGVKSLVLLDRLAAAIKRATTF